MQCHIVCFHLFIPLNVFYTCTFKLIKPMENILFFSGTYILQSNNFI